MKPLSNLALLISLVSATPLPLQNVLELELNFNLDAITTESKYTAPAPAPAKKNPLVDSDSLQALITEDDLRTGSEALWNISQYSIPDFGHPTRVIGSKGHFKTIDYIKSEIHKLGGYYNVSVQPFDAFMSEVYNYKATIDGVQPKSLVELDSSPSTPNKDFVHGALVHVANNGCLESDYPDEIDGGIALIQRGLCALGTKAAVSGKLGAKATFIYNNEPGSFQGTLDVPKDGGRVVLAPSVGLSQTEGEKYAALLKSGKSLEASVLVDSYVGNITTFNVIAESVEGDPENIVMLGAHSDSFTAGPGINDDGSGTVSQLTVAKHLTNFSLKNKVRFAWWAAEEEGGVGSTYYLEHLTPEENQKIRLFMDYDMMASPNYEFGVYDANNEDNPAGSEELKDLYVDYYTIHGLNYDLIPLDGRSDYVAFIKNHIPGGGIATGAEGINGVNGIPFDVCYHQLCDDLDNLAYDAFLVNTKLIAHSVATYANSLEGFPKRDYYKDGPFNGFAGVSLSSQDEPAVFTPQIKCTKVII
ncbi:unnamed protein product [Ambrosiozyma monospora]|uniref:Unnamed protein product n=1 Tax=Ambrosiozyma monospora TaxID=43982 RepID=A0ACB5ST31_AMBMO|nr:unnamed protein product [Ambrosiozyma monospora]